MDWTELRLTVPVSDTDRAADIANMVVPYGLYIEDYSDLEEGAREIAHIDLIDEELLARDRNHSTIHLYISPEENPAEAAAYLRERLTAAGIPHELAAEQVSEDDWANNWKAYFKPLPVGQRLLIRPTWETVEDAGGRQMLSIDPGMAFGTGGHDTTRLVLETLERHITPETDLLDVGCGTGILGIAAVQLGARECLAVDRDEVAVSACRHNVALNGCEEKVTPVHGNLADQAEGQYDLIFANIVADAVIALLPEAKAHLAKNGTIIASGIILEREADVLAAADKAGLAVLDRKNKGEWVALALGER